MPPISEMVRTLAPGTWLTPAVLATLKVTVLVATGSLLVATLARASAATRHLVWTLTLLGTLAIPFATPVVPAWPVRWMTALERRATPAIAHVLPDAPARVGRTASPSPDAARVTPARPAVVPPAAAVSPDVSRPSVAAPPSPQSTLDLSFLPRSPLALLPILWLAGVLLLAGRRLAASRRLAALERRAQRVTDPRWLALLEACARVLGVRRAIALRTSDEVAVPMTWGTRRPVILLPSSARAWNDERRRIVLLHELAHVRRFDTLTLSLARLATTVHWFHPLVWVAVRRMRHEAECACDDRVLGAGMRPSSYAGDLLAIARDAREDDRLASAALAMARPSRLEGRLLAILDPRRARGAAGRTAFATAWLTMLAGVGVLAAVRPAQSVVSDLEARAARPIRATTRAATAATAPAAKAASTATHATTTCDDGSNCPSTAHAAEAAMTAATAAEAPLTAALEASMVAAAPPAKASGVTESSTSHSHGSTHSSWSIIEDGGRKTWKGYWTDGGRKVTVDAEGEIRFGGDFTGIESIGDGGYFRLTDEQNGHTRRLEFRPRAGRIERTYFVDNVARPWDDDSRAWAENAFVDLDRHTGVLIDRRFPALMAGGPDAVLREISQIPSDYVKGLYFAKLLATNLDRAAMSRAVAQAGREIDSDYELAQMLIRAAERRALEDQQTRDAFIDAANTLESDYEHARVLLLPAERGNLSTAEVTALLRSAARIGSDYERGRVLAAVTKSSTLEAAAQRDYIAAASAMRSDYEKGNALRALLQPGRLSDANAGPFLDAVSRMSSDYETANVLVLVASRVRLDERGREAFRRVAATLGDYERNRALAALGGRDSQ